MRTIYTIVGMKHRGPAAVAAVSALKQGDAVTLIREPDNQYDPRAIQVWVGGIHVGYVPTKMNKDLTERLEARGQMFRRPIGPVKVLDSADPSGADVPDFKSYAGAEGRFATYDRQPAVEIDE